MAQLEMKEEQLRTMRQLLEETQQELERKDRLLTERVTELEELRRSQPQGLERTVDHLNSEDESNPEGGARANGCENSPPSAPALDTLDSSCAWPGPSDQDQDPAAAAAAQTPEGPLYSSLVSSEASPNPDFPSTSYANVSVSAPPPYPMETRALWDGEEQRPPASSFPRGHQDQLPMPPSNNGPVGGHSEAENEGWTDLGASAAQGQNQEEDTSSDAQQQAAPYTPEPSLFPVPGQGVGRLWGDAAQGATYYLPPGAAEVRKAQPQWCIAPGCSKLTDSCQPNEYCSWTCQLKAQQAAAHEGGGVSST